MLAEALVIYTCVHSLGCKETSSQYALTYPEVATHLERQVKPYERYFPYIHLLATKRYIFSHDAYTLLLEETNMAATYTKTF